LPTAEHIDPTWNKRVDARRHRHAHQKNQWKQYEYHHQVGDLLQHVIALRRLSLRVAEAQMIEEGPADGAYVVAIGRKIAREVPARDRIREITDAVDYEYPGEEKMPSSRHRQPAFVGDRHPGRETAGNQRSVGSACRAQPPGGVEFVSENPCLADDAVVGSGI